MLSYLCSNEPQRLFARFCNYFSCVYTSHYFITAKHRCAFTTTLHPSTSIYIRLLAVPKVESTIPLNPHSLISTNLSVGAPAGILPLPLFQEALLTHSSTTQPPHLKQRKSPSDQVRSVASYVGNINSPCFYPTKNQSFPKKLP